MKKDAYEGENYSWRSSVEGLLLRAGELLILVQTRKSVTKYEFYNVLSLSVYSNTLPFS